MWLPAPIKHVYDKVVSRINWQQQSTEAASDRQKTWQSDKVIIIKQVHVKIYNKQHQKSTIHSTLDAINDLTIQE